VIGLDAAPSVVLVHPIQVAIAPVDAAFRRLWQQALLSDLLAVLERAGQRTLELHERIGRPVDHVVGIGAQGVLFTFSAIRAAKAAYTPVTVLKPDPALFDLGLKSGLGIGMLATFAPAASNIESDFQATVKPRGIEAQIKSVSVPEAVAAACAGDSGDTACCWFMRLHSRSIAAL
jgi:hypothetical protein